MSYNHPFVLYYLTVLVYTTDRYSPQCRWLAMAIYRQMVVNYIFSQMFYQDRT